MLPLQLVGSPLPLWNVEKEFGGFLYNWTNLRTQKKIQRSDNDDDADDDNADDKEEEDFFGVFVDIFLWNRMKNISLLTNKETVGLVRFFFSIYIYKWHLTRLELWDYSSSSKL